MTREGPRTRINLIDSKIQNPREGGDSTAGFNPENEGSFSKLSAKAKEMASKAYKGFGKIKIPGVGGKLGIAYNQFWLDKHQEKAVGLKNKMDGFDLKVGTLDQSRKEIQAVVEDLKRQRIPGAESLELKLKVLDYKRIELLNKRDQTQSEFESVDNKKKLYTNKRDQIANGFIERYDQKIKPMEEELERLKTSRDEAELLMTVAEVKHQDILTRLGDVEKRKKRVEEALWGTGMSEKEIGNFEAIRMMQDMITEGREKIRREKEELNRKKADIDNKIAKADARANPYRDKREQFVRVKENRPLQVEVNPRQRNPEFRGTEEVRTNPRAEAGEGPSVLGESERGTEGTRGGSLFEEPQGEPDSVEGNEEIRLTVYAHLANWNNHVEARYGSGDMISIRDFLRVTRLSEGSLVNLEGFGKILEKYYKLKKIQMDKFREVMTNLGN